MRPFHLAVLVALCATSACVAPVRAERVGADAVLAAVREDALVSGDPGVFARLALERADLADRWKDDPAGAIVALHEMATTLDTRERLYGLSELSFVEGLRTNDPRWYLGSAVYAYLYLFGQADAPPPGPFDPRFRSACDLYERGVAEAFRDEDSGEFRPRAGRFPLPVGSIDVSVPSMHVKIGDVEFDAFDCADDYELKGMRSRVRSAGLGVPLIVSRRVAPGSADPEFVSGRMPPRLRLAASAILKIDGELADLAPERARADLELHSPYDQAMFVTVRGQTVPLTTDFTAPIAVGLGDSRMWRFERRGFLRRDAETIPNGLLLTSPYRRGAIPLVLVHGTASSPARWAELFNELSADPVIGQRYQFWMFIYGTGAPILTSAASLRDAVRDAVRRLDPDGADPALRRMVMIGHSQGGLLSRLMATSSGDRFWRNFSEEPFETMDLEPDERDLLRSAFFFEPVPQLARVIFISTPHRGSFVAGNAIGKLGAALISAPKKLANTTTNAVKRNVARVRGAAIGALPTAVDNMQPGSAFLDALDDLPIDPRVKVNSIVSVDGDGPVEEGDDGVVAYKSAHLPDAESEIVVRSPHSCQGHPRTILEIRRILRAHAAPQ